MRFGESEVVLLSDGSFTLDPGAAFGIVPTPFWSKRFSTTENGRVRLALHIPYIMGRDFHALIDAGIGTTPDEKYRKIFEIEKSADLPRQLDQYGGPETVDLIINSHLHFDHFGHCLDRSNSGWLFRNATVVAQNDEYAAFRKPNEFTVANYGWLDRGQLPKVRKIALRGTTRLGHGIQAVHTGGHTKGHQAVIFSEGGRELIYFGDLIPTAFHTKLPYMTAIDTFPLQSLEMKRKLISRAIRKKSICIFNHDMETPAALLSGTPSDVKIEPVSL